MTTITAREAVEILSGNLSQGGGVEARFLKVGDVIERHSLMFVVCTNTQESAAQPGHVVFSVYNEHGGIQALSVHGRVEVPLFDSLTDEEALAVWNSFGH